jgi:hypothetical protein
MEDGKWMWYHDPDILVTPFGEIKIDRSKVSTGAGPSPVPKDLGQAAAAEAASKLTVDASTSKKELLFEKGQPGNDEIVYHNGLQGPIVVNADIVGDYRAFSVEPAVTQLQSGKDLVLKVVYKPSEHPVGTALRLVIDPLNGTLLVPIRFKSASTDSR